MRLVLLSGGSGKRLWPLSHETQEKQFLKMLRSPSGELESMLQRVVRQLKESGIVDIDKLTLATSESQKSEIREQIGDGVDIVVEPCRRDTFPAIALSAAYLAYSKSCSEDEVVVVMPCDPYTESGYFEAIAKMAEAVEAGVADLVLMGIRPTYPSMKYGYIVPCQSGLSAVEQFKEKPDLEGAKELLSRGALWNGGVFAFKLGYLLKVVSKYLPYKDFESIRSDYDLLPKISFDYEVVEKAGSVAVVPYDGDWKDLGTWNTFTEEIYDTKIGNVVVDPACERTHIINKTNIPVMGIGLKNLVVVVTDKGILISEKSCSEKVKDLL